jgi:hypothetical protein
MVNEVIDFVTGRSVNFEIFRHPGNYMVWLPLTQIIADSKVSRQGIEHYKEMILRNEDTGPIILLKDPMNDLYVVLDGHHRYYAYQELGKEKISCAVVGDYSDVLFYLALNGRFQPHGLITDFLRHPLMRINKSLKQLSKKREPMN